MEEKISFGDRVRVRSTSLTERLGLRGLVGHVVEGDSGKRSRKCWSHARR